MPLLEGLDGVNKMSKSLGNYIGINEPAIDIVTKTMKIGDDLMWRWIELLSFEIGIAGSRAARREIERRTTQSTRPQAASRTRAGCAVP
jgi:tyrosyl-tRNA synthetase